MRDRGDDIILSEVMARVAFRLVQKSYDKCPGLYDNPIVGLCRLSDTLEIEGFRALSMWVAAAAFHKSRSGGSVSQWRDQVVWRARMHHLYRCTGQPWRKARDPRVTNRGVTLPGTLVRYAWGERRPRWRDDK